MCLLCQQICRDVPMRHQCNLSTCTYLHCGCRLLDCCAAAAQRLDRLELLAALRYSVHAVCRHEHVNAAVVIHHGHAVQYLCLESKRHCEYCQEWLQLLDLVTAFSDNMTYIGIVKPCQCSIPEQGGYRVQGRAHTQQRGRPAVALCVRDAAADKVVVVAATPTQPPTVCVKCQARHDEHAQRRRTLQHCTANVLVKIAADQRDEM